MIERTIELGMQPWVTTNAILLEERIGALHAAGLRQITVGYYGTGADYDAYVQRKNRYARLDAGFAAVRDRWNGRAPSHQLAPRVLPATSPTSGGVRLARAVWR